LVDSEEESGALFSFVTLVLSNNTWSTKTNTSLLSTLTPGSYTLSFYPPLSVAPGDLGILVATELEISTQENVLNAIAQNPTTCSTSVFDVIKVSPAGSFHSGITNATFNYDLLVSQIELAFIPFTIDRDSWVFAHVGFDFMINELDVKITGNGIQLNSLIIKNIREIHQVTLFFPLPTPHPYSTLLNNN
jgi:hypothetical protein